jgi:hypothetical protein
MRYGIAGILTVAAAVAWATLLWLPYTALEDGIFAHPTLAEGLNTLFTSMEK